MENTSLSHQSNRLLIDPFPKHNIFGIHMRLQFSFLINVEHL